MQDPELDPQRSQYGSETQLAVSPSLRTVAIAPRPEDKFVALIKLENTTFFSGNIL
jgi:hypothetical protein